MKDTSSSVFLKQLSSYGWPLIPDSRYYCKEVKGGRAKVRLLVTKMRKILQVDRKLIKSEIGWNPKRWWYLTNLTHGIFW
jgi:hypothetical protein